METIRQPLKLSNNEWIRLVFQSAQAITIAQLNAFYGPDLGLGDISFLQKGNKEHDTLRKLFEINKILTPDEIRPGSDGNKLVRVYRQRHKEFITRLSEDIKAKKQFRHIVELKKVLNDNLEKFSPLASVLLSGDVNTLYLLLCSSDRFLVGIKGAPAYKEVVLPPLGSPVPIYTAFVTDPYISFLEHIGQKELPVVPRFMLPDNQLHLLRLPKPERSTYRVLENAYFNQRYTINPEGAVVHFRNAGGLRKAVVMLSGEMLMGNFDTPYGDLFAAIDLNKGAFHGPDVQELIEEGKPQKSRMCNFLAEVYHDIVTAIEIPVSEESSIQFRVLNRGTEKRKMLDPEIGYIYITRIVRTGKINRAPRIEYSGPARPIRPHRVTGYKRKGEMTERHLDALADWEEETGLKVPLIPVGYTYVRPHFSPREAEGRIKELPQFIKRRINSVLAGIKEDDEDEI